MSALPAEETAGFPFWWLPVRKELWQIGDLTLSRQRFRRSSRTDALHHPNGGHVHHIFYLPCFNGEAQELLQWEKGLHHAKFGVTMKSFQDQRIVALIPLEQLLLETDTLYLPPAPGCRLNHPWNVLFLAKQVYFIRNTLDRSSVCPLEGG